MGKGFGDGSKLFQKRGKKALPLLVALAKSGRDITYQQLARQMGIHHRTLAFPLGAIGEELKALGKTWHETIPPINCLVVNKSKHTPGKGIKFAMPYQQFQKLTPLAKREVMRGLYAKVWGYPKWGNVLKNFGLAPAVPADSLEPLATKAKYGHYGSGESEEHRILKSYLSLHPQLLRLAKHAAVTEEYPFISADRIDLLFKVQATWVGVEVKGSNVDDAELMRGIFQAVKYQALIEAHQRYEQKTVDSKVFLATGRKLSSELTKLADLLGVEVVDDISIPIAFASKVKSAKAGST